MLSDILASNRLNNGILLQVGGGAEVSIGGTFQMVFSLA
jgi:hypothetical protein